MSSARNRPSGFYGNVRTIHDLGKRSDSDDDEIKSDLRSKRYRELQEFIQRAKQKLSVHKLKLAIWLLLFFVAVRVEFGAVYLLISAFVIMYYNTRTGTKSNVPSAYSVFNKNLRPIAGDRDPGSLDDQLRSGTLW